MDLLYSSPPSCDAVSLSNLVDDTHRKQVMYAGKFVKKTPSENVEFEVTRDVLDRWASEGNKMLSEGIACTMPLEHSGMKNPEKKRGDVVQWERGYDSKGRDSLFAHFSFTDEDSAARLATTDVSIYVPESYTNAATGETYKAPIRHVAFTDYPVIPGLEKTETLSLSYQEPTTMSYLALAKKMNIELKDDATEDDAETAILEANKAKPDEPSASDKVTDPPKETVTSPARKEQPALAAGFINMAVESREGKIDSLVTGGHVTPAAAKELKTRFAGKERVTLALSESGEINDGFDDMFAVLKQNKALNLSSATGPQKDMKDPTQNPLLADADRRAKS